MRVHILGICGTFMGGIAALAREAGHEVSGSDLNVYPPMSSQLEALGIHLTEGWDPAQLEPAPDIVLVGNALSRGNPAVEAVLNRGLAYASGPEWLAQHVLHGRWVLAVAGTHGKTTTAGLLAWMLEHAGLDPGFLIGGVPGNFAVTARLGSAPFFVVEADEYDTAFFDKRAKFVHYRPRTAILNNLEFDHADIYPDVAAIRRMFHQLVRTVPGDGRLIVNGADAELARALALGCWTPVERFGRDAGEWQVSALVPDWSELEFREGAGVVGRARWDLIGAHNAANALAAALAARHAGVPMATALDALGSFRNARRRLELRGTVRGVAVYDDFAHHPTAIATTLDGLRKRVGAARIIAVLEPRSATMRLGVHRDTLAGSLAAADRVFLFEPPDLGWDVAAAAKPLGARASVLGAVGALAEAIAAEARAGDHVLVMSNGGFGGLHERLLAALGEYAVNSRTLPLFPLGTVLFPGGPLSLRIFEPRYVDMVGRCMREGGGFGVVLLVEGLEAGGGTLTTAAIGTEARIVDFNRLDDGLLGLTCLGGERLRILRAWRQDDGLNLGEVEDLPADPPAAIPADCAHLPAVLRRFYPDLGATYERVTPHWDDAAWVANRLAELAPLEPAAKQGLLELDDPVKRLQYLAPLIRVGPDAADA